MAVDVRAHLDLLDLDDPLVLARFGRLLLVGVFQLAEVEDLDDGRRGVGGDFDEVEAGLFGSQERFVDGDVAAVLAVGVDELDPGNPDVAVGARAVLGGRGCFKRSANGRGLLEPLTSVGFGRANVGSARAMSIAQQSQQITSICFCGLRQTKVFRGTVRHCRAVPQVRAKGI
ncbi:hypothetical protein J2X50_003330 [Aminobacter sp. BE322]